MKLAIRSLVASLVLAVPLLIGFGSSASAAPGDICISGSYGKYTYLVVEGVDTLTASLSKAGVTIFSRTFHFVGGCAKLLAELHEH